jgi:CRP/FNR family transcriptional regulator, cyclic AMP receptor protein
MSDEGASKPQSQNPLLYMERGMNRQKYLIMRVVKKMPLFKGLEEKEATSLLRICRPVSYKQGEGIYSAGEASDDMLILLDGKLRVASTAGDELAVIDMGGSIGEMGLFSGAPRSAHVISLEDSTGIVISKADLFRLLHNNKDMHLKILYNMVQLLSSRLAATDNLIGSLNTSGNMDDDDDDDYDDEDDYDEDDDEEDDDDEDDEDDDDD